MELVIEDPFASNHITSGGTGDKIPRFVGLERRELLYHGISSIGVSESALIGLGKGRQS
jgi:hypothetical protein